MGFSGGGANITKPHTHSNAIVQDGGSLNFDNITQASLAAGDITYSNGTALQVLGIGSATDTLTVNAGATAPEWATPAAGGSNWEELASIGPFAYTSSLDTGAFAEKESLYCQICAAQVTTTNQCVKFNGDNSANYNWRGQANDGTQSSRSAVSNGIIYVYNLGNTTEFCLAQMFISNVATQQKLVVINTVNANGTGNDTPTQEFCWGKFNDTTDPITSIQWGNDGASLTSSQAGSYMRVYGC